MKIIRLIAENIKRLRAVNVTPTGNIIKITGKNAAGKSTILDCIWWALGGSAAVQDMPIRAGQDKASIRLDLGDYTVTRTFTPSGTYLKVENADGAQFKSPQAMLDKLLSEYTFDPLAFSSAGPKDQVNTILSLGKLEVDWMEVERIACIAPDKRLSPLEAIASVRDALYTRRRDTNRALEQAKAVALTVADAQPAEPVELRALYEQKTVVERNIAETERLQAASAQLLNDVKSRMLKIDRARENHAKQVAQLEQELKETVDNLFAEIKAAELKQVDVKNRLLKCSEQPIDATEIESKIEQADAMNASAARYDQRIAAEREQDRLEKESSAVSERIASLDAYKAGLIGVMKLPLPELGVTVVNGSSTVTYNDIPLAQASSAQRLEVSMAVAMALNPTLRVLRVENASLLDSEHMAVIERMAADKDYQIWMEIVDESGKVGVHIADGMVTSVDGTPVDNPTVGD